MLSSLRNNAVRRRDFQRSTRRLCPRRSMQAETLECRRLLAGDVGIHFDLHGEPNPDEPFPGVTVNGVKWEDANGNGVFDRGERGLPGVTIYSDLNGNGLFDAFEPHRVTMRDLPETEDVNEAGMYTLDRLEPGLHFIREVVPGGFRQTFPGFGPHPFDPHGGDGMDGESGDPGDEFATVQPARIDINSEVGESFIAEVSLTIHPVCFRPFEVDVVASDPDVEVINESGIQLNGCGGDTSRFNVTVFVHDVMNREFELQFVDAEFGGVLGSIPVRFTRGVDGAHVIEAPHGGFFAGIHFGNVRLFEPGSVHGRKWSDDNGNGVQDADEQGLAGGRIYADLNENGSLDRGEPSTVSMRDNPDTDFDEAGLYWLEGLRPGRRIIREVVPRGYQQSFPGLSSTVVSSETGRFHAGVAIDLDITGAAIVPDLNAPAVDIELTVTWPDSCGDLISDLSVATIVDNTILVSLHGHQVGDACLTVISPQQETVRVGSLDLRQYDVVVTLNEELRDGSTRATLNAVGAIALGGFGSHVVRVEPSQAVENINFGNQPLPPGSAHGTKWIDENGNRQRDDGEDPLPGVVIYADLNFNGRLDVDEPSTETMDDGSYWLEGLRPGTHVISEVVPDGFIQTFPGLAGVIDATIVRPDITDLSGHVVQIESGREATGLDFGNQPIRPGSIHGTKWVDENGNGVRDDGEPGLPGVTIYVDLNRNGQFDADEPHAVTMEDFNDDLIDDNGKYWLEGLAAGDYIIREIVPDGFMQTFPQTDIWFSAQGAMPFLGGGAHYVRLENGQEITGIDFGNQRFEPGSVHGTKWIDGNGNGQRDDDEGPLAGVVIYSDLNFNGRLDAGEPRTETMEDGAYWLEGLRPSVHVISEVVPDGFIQTFPGQIGIIGDSPFPVPPGIWNLSSHVVPIESGQEIMGLDFGNQPFEPVSVHGAKWIDENGNRQRDEGEDPLPGVLIYSDLNFNGHLDAGEPRTETMDDGSYWLEGLRPGIHMISEVIPDGFIQTVPGQLGDILLTFEPPFGVWDLYGHLLQLESGQQATGLDFGNQPIGPGSIHGTKWLDANGNGVRDHGERGLPGVTIYIDMNQNGEFDEDEPHAVTMEDDNLDPIDDNGKYWLEGLEPGPYTIREVVPAGFIQTFPLIEFTSIQPDRPLPVLIGGAHSVWLRNAEEITGIDFGNQRIRPGSIHGTKWLDENGNGVRDGGEPGLPGVTIYVDLNSNRQLDEGEPHTITMEDFNDDLIDDNGKYWLEGLDPGHYVIREIVPDGFVQTFPGAFVHNSVGIPIPFFGPGAHFVRLRNGAEVADIDFGNQRDVPGSIHGLKWLDENGNGIRDDGEPGLAGVTIYSDLNNNGVLDDGEPRAVSMLDLINADGLHDDTGKYWLAGLSAGVHVIREIVPDGFVQTFPERLPLPLPFDAPGDIVIDPPYEDGAHIIVLGVGQIVDGVDFGNRRFEPASVHGIKWLDRNGNGERDPGEPGVPGVMIYSDVDMDGVLESWEPHTATMSDDPNTIADETGHYWLEDLRPGGHVIREVVPDGFVQTFPPFDFWPEPFIGEDGQPIDGFPIPPPNDNGGHWVWLDHGERREGIDFGNQPRVELATVHGRKWVDRNGNGERDPDEPGLAGVVIYDDANLNNRFDPGEPSTVTMRDDPDTLRDESGLYWLGGIEPGLALIREIVPDGFEQTFPGVLLCEATFCVGRAHMLSLDPGEVVERIDFGNEPLDRETGSIHGMKWNDTNGNGQRDQGEPGLPGVAVYVDRNNNGRLDDDEPRAVTMRDDPNTNVNEAGRYWLENLPPGRHIVREIVPRGFEQTFPRAGGSRIIDAHSVRREPIDALGFELVGVEQVVSAAGSLGTDLTFSVTWPDACGLIDSKHQIDGDGRIHIEMFVMFDPSAAPDQFCAPVVTELSHTVHVGALPEGRHDLRAELHEPGNQESVSYVVEATFAIGGNGVHVVALEPGDVVRGIDFGNQPIDAKLGSLHGRKWSDRNGNGEPDPGEPGLPGVVIWLDVNLNGRFDADDPHTRTMRDNPDTDFDEAGLYWFDGLEAGFYVVHEVVPEGFIPTYPEPFLCLAVFCNGHGHMVNMEAGETIDGLNFGNQPTFTDAGAIEGFKWLDRNGNGRADADEPGLPGVTIYLDLNNNGVLDPREPHVESRFDDPHTRINEAGHYRIDNVRSGEHVVREVVPDGFEQTFPRGGFGRVIESISIPREPRAVHLFELVAAGESITADGTVGIGLTYLLQHEPELCAPIFNSSARIDDDGRIHVEMSARPDPASFCANVPMESTHTVVVPGITSGRHEVRAELFELFGGDGQLSFLNEAVVEIGHGNGGHVVVVEPGQTSEGVNFGNVRVGAGPSRAVWDGEAPVGQTGDGANWEDPDNWTVDGEADRIPPDDEETNVGSHVILAPGGAQTIHVGAHHTVNSLRFMDDYHLVGDQMTIASGVIQVDAGVVGTLALGLTGPVVKSGHGKLTLAGEADDVTVTAGTLGGATTLGHLQVGPAAIVAPGSSAGVLQVASADFELDSTLAIEIGGLTESQHDSLVSQGVVSLAGTLTVELMDDFRGLAPGESTTVTIVQGSTIQGRFANLSGWHHLKRGVFYQLTYGPTTVGVELRQALPGDANGDGGVDATDLGTWRDNRFGFGGWQNGDFNNDHAVDGSDFGIWLAHRFETFEMAAAATAPHRPPRAPVAAVAVAVQPPMTRISDAPFFASPMLHSELLTAPNSPVPDRVAAAEAVSLPTWESRRVASIFDLLYARTRSNADAHEGGAANANEEDWAVDVDVAFSQLGRR